MDLTQSKGKPITTSVPTFAIRFHAEDEELEEVYSYSHETDVATLEKTSDLREEDESSRASTPSSSSVTIPHHALGGSSREISPSKDCPPKLGKRSSSVDSVGSAAAIGTGSSSVSDTWNIFQELRGKIVKRVEETLNKTDRSGKKLGPGSILPGTRGSQENSSISDSEDGAIPVVSGDEALPKEYGLESEAEALTAELDDKDETPVANATFFIGEPETKVEDSSQEDRFPCKIYELRKRISPQVAENHEQQDEPGPSGSTTQPITAQPLISSVSSLFARWEKKQPEEEEEFENDIDEEFEVLGDSPEEAEEVLEETPLNADVGSSVPYSTVSHWITPSLMNASDRPQAPNSTVNLLPGWSTPTLFVICLLCCTFSFVLPSLLLGIFLGICLSIPFGLLFHWWNYGSWLPSRSKDSSLQEAFAVPDYGKLPILEVPAAKEYQPLPRYEGWMNQYPYEYDPSSYNVGRTKPALVRLEGHLLRLSYTRSRIPRRAMWYEPTTLRAPVCHWVDYNIKNCPVMLLPDGLARKRLWSKKYPICIVLKRGSLLSTTFATVDAEKDSSPTPTDGSEYIKEAEESTVEKETYSKDSDEATDGENSIASSANYPTDVPKQTSARNEDDEWSLDEEEYFCPVGGELMKVPGRFLYLFARTDREKDDWFRRFVSSSRSKATRADDEIFAPDYVADQFTPDDNNPGSETLPNWTESSHATDAEFQRFISRFLNKVHRIRRHGPSLGRARSVSASQGSSSASGPTTPTHGPTTPTHGPTKKPADASDKEEASESNRETVEGLSEEDKELLLASLKSISSDVVWANVLLARVLFDVLRDRYWINKVQDKIQRKLNTIKLPNFVEHLLVTALDLGHSVPVIHRASQPIQDKRGIWVDLDITYEGQACLTLETRLNLMRLKKSTTNGSTDVPEQQSPTEKDTGRSPMFYSDVEDSAESSSDEEITPSKTDEGHGTPTSKKKILQMVDKIASSKYFQQATEYKYIKRAMEGVSNTRLILSVELKGVVGTLAVNIPPPPSDRLWYGFRTNPRLWLTARPKLGERQVNIAHITNLIEKKLCFVIQKIFVLPNMDDLIIPVMSTQLPH